MNQEKEKPPRASIIILTKNGEKHLHSLLDGIRAQYPANCAEVIVIDSGSTDRTLDIVRKYEEVRLLQISPEEFGHGKTRNLGASIAIGKVLVFIPQDATPVGCTWLADLLHPLDNPKVAGVYARQLARPDASPMEKFFLAHTYQPYPEIRTIGKSESISLASCFFSTVSGAVRASIWKCHPFREDIIMSEDQAWASEVMLLGYAIAYQPDAVVLHSHQYGIGDIFRRNFDSGYSVQQIFAGKTGISFIKSALYLIHEALFVAKTGTKADFFKFLPYEIARHLGFWVGLHGDRLPLRLRKTCSNLGYFWIKTKSEGGKGQSY